MQKMTYHQNGRTYTRVNKAYARKLYNDGKAVALVPSNLNPTSPFVGFYVIEDADFDGDNLTCNVPKEERDTFDQRVNSFEYYNCTSNETGKHANFFEIG